MEENLIKVLLVDDDYEDYLITRDLFSEFRGEGFQLEWASSYHEALEAMSLGEHDVYLLDYRLGAVSGLDLLRERSAGGCTVPMILLTGQGDHEVDMEAMKAGAADFLVKGKLDAALLERSIRYAVERKRGEERVMRAAYFDTVTMLPNRLLFGDRLQNTIVQADRNSKKVAVLFLDLDNFKRINETLGHRIGDLLLKYAGERMQGCIRKGDTVSRPAVDLVNPSVARLGGDEFAVLLPELNHFEDAARVAARVLDAMSAPFSLQEHDVFVTASAGIAVYPTDGQDVDTLVKNADSAMYHAKSHGKNSFRFYEQRMNSAAMERLTLENDLHRALERQELLLHYQPQLDLESGEIVGVEALVRWQHPSRGLVPPDRFIPLAEETGLIIPIGEWVLRTACAQAHAWHRAGIAALRVSVNVSTHQLRQHDLEKMVLDILDETGLPAEYLELELTESIMMQNIDANISLIQELKAVGLSFSIDDFGTGYSSFNYLKKLPMDGIKIDRSFVRDITSHAEDAAIVAAIIAMAHSLKLKVVAEGVETEEQLSILREKGCDLLQGYLLSRPLPAEEITRLLLGGSALRVMTLSGDAAGKAATRKELPDAQRAVA